ncbi:MAG: group II intron reverse transcriptase/maturase [Chlorobiales bacterium]|nr:group II intron reverse transcriptase/maturase [Chlorobiales bacterium]
METNTEDKLILIAKHAKEKPKLGFISLMHLLNEEYLQGCYHQLKRGKAPGVDGRTLESYTAEEMYQAIEDTVRMMKQKRYKPQPVRRVSIDKGNGKKRSLGIPTVIDKVIQLGMTRILEAIYEPTFLPISYGYRQGRGAHEALKEINHMLMQEKVNWIVEADIKGFFDHIDHTWMLRCVGERIKDPNFIQLIKKFLQAGVMEGNYIPTTEGTPQGGIISPMLANIYLHYVLDLWFERREKRQMQGYTKFVRYADDFLIGAQHKPDAEKIRTDVAERLQQFGLELSAEKTKVLEFGRFAKQNSLRRGKRKPDTFDFLGFTHYCTETRDKRFMVGVRTSRKRINRAIVAMNIWLKGVRNLVSTEGIWEKLSLKLTGHYNYYGISGNFAQINRYYHRTRTLTLKWMNRRSRKKSWNWQGFEKYLTTYPLPEPKLTYAIYNTW